MKNDYNFSKTTEDNFENNSKKRFDKFGKRFSKPIKI